MQRAETLESYLAELRRNAGLSVEAVCLKTKIQPRFVEALEAGRWGEAPSNTHVRAFSVAIAVACGGDGAKAAELALRTLAATAPVPAAGRPAKSFDTPAPSPALAVEAPPSGPAYAAAGGPSLRDSSIGAASARLRALPVGALLTLLAVAGALSYGAAWSVEQWRRHEVAAILGAASAPPSPAPAASSPALPAAVPVPAPGAEAAAPGAEAAAAGIELALRARRPCWLVLEIDGRRLPTVTMQDGDKLRWTVSRRAVLLAGNVGALRVWWQGDNLGYLGPLDSRLNGLVFERGHEPRRDPSAALALPAGIE